MTAADTAIHSARWCGDNSKPALNLTVGDMLRQQAAKRGEGIALKWLSSQGIHQMSYRELLMAAEKLAQWLLTHAAVGSRVAIWGGNSVHWVVVEYGCALAGMNLTPWNTAWTNLEVDQALEMTTPSIVFAGNDTRGVSLLTRASRLSSLALVMDLEQIFELDSKHSDPLPEVSPEMPFLVQFTSGTTGRAKGAQLSHRSAINGGYLRAIATAGCEHDVYLNPTPLHHIAGSVSLVLGSLTIGATYVIVANSKPEELIRAAQLSGASCFGGVPTMLIAMLEHKDFPHGQLRFRNLGSGGTQVPPALVERLGREFQAVVSVGYGQSECPLISNTAQTDSPELISNTVGQPCAGTEVKIINPENGALLRFDSVGEICVRSAAVMSGYYGDPEATRNAIDAEGFLHTGDLASMDRNGYLRIQGRAREVIIRGGENIYPIQVEQILHQHPAVSIAAVVGVPDDKWGQQVGVVLRLVPEHATNEQELIAFLQPRIAHFCIPKYWRFVDSLPMTASGKVKKMELSTLFEASQSRM